MNAGRRHALTIAPPQSGLPLIKSAPTLGKRLVWLKGRIDVDSEMSEGQRKARVKWGAERFIEWMQKEEGAIFQHQIEVQGPYPHFNAQLPKTQYGANGASRKVARSIIEDTSGNGKEDYIILGLFTVPEHIQEIPTSLAQEMFKDGPLPYLRPLREKEWSQWYKQQ